MGLGATSIQTVTTQKTHWSASDAKTPHIHLRKQIHLEHNAENRHHIQQALTLRLEFRRTWFIFLSLFCFHRISNSLCISSFHRYHSVRQRSESQWTVSVSHRRVRWFPGPKDKQPQLDFILSTFFLSAIWQLRGQYLVQQAKLRVLLLWVFTAWVWMFLHQEDISLFTLENIHKYYYCYVIRATLFGFMQGFLYFLPSMREMRVTTFRLQQNRSIFYILFHTQHYHCLYYVVGPGELPRSLTSCHALPIFINERNDILKQTHISISDKVQRHWSF